MTDPADLARTGRFITVEGGEGAGKSTQVGMLVASLEAAGLSVVRTREPGGSPGAEDIRALLIQGGVDRWDGITELLLHSAARRDHVQRTIRPALAKGQWVVCDRFFDSTWAYQGRGHGVDGEAIELATRLAIGDFRPDLTFILDIDLQHGLARALGRGGAEDRYERMGADFHARLRQGFLDIAQQDPRRCRLIDAAGSPQDVHGRIWAHVAGFLP